jgi:hypothetical protein
MSIECILIATFTNYMVFYTQNVYLVTSSTSSILVGGVIVPSAIIGAVLGGFLIKKFKFDIEGCTNLIMFNSVLVVGCVLVLLFVKCDGTNSVGINLTKQTFSTNFTSCNSDCVCQNTIYNPICDQNGITYVSPCYAGCSKLTNNVKL